MQIKTKVRGGPRTCGGGVIIYTGGSGPYNPNNPYEMEP